MCYLLVCITKALRAAGRQNSVLVTVITWDWVQIYRWSVTQIKQRMLWQYYGHSFIYCETCVNLLYSVVSWLMSNAARICVCTLPLPYHRVTIFWRVCSVTSLGLVSPGAATDGAILFFREKTGNFLLVVALWKVTTFFSCCFLTTPIFPHRLSSVLSKFSH